MKSKGKKAVALAFAALTLGTSANLFAADSPELTHGGTSGQEAGLVPEPYVPPTVTPDPKPDPDPKPTPIPTPTPTPGGNNNSSESSSNSETQPPRNANTLRREGGRTYDVFSKTPVGIASGSFKSVISQWEAEHPGYKIYATINATPDIRYGIVRPNGSWLELGLRAELTKVLNCQRTVSKVNPTPEVTHDRAQKIAHSKINLAGGIDRTRDRQS